MAVAAVLIVAAFAAGYLFRSSPLADRLSDGGQVLAQSPAPTPSPAPLSSPKGAPDRQRKGEKGEVVGMLESVRDHTLILKVTSARTTGVQQGATLTVQVDDRATILREIALTDLKKGNTVTLRGSMADGKFVVSSVTVER
ncbi:MAG TPA: hypothetical protein VGR25_05305 [bacterium]|nr:hypothetical protein [bacterium]